MNNLTFKEDHMKAMFKTASYWRNLVVLLLLCCGFCLLPEVCSSVQATGHQGDREKSTITPIILAEQHAGKYEGQSISKGNAAELADHTHLSPLESDTTDELPQQITFVSLPAQTQRVGNLNGLTPTYESQSRNPDIPPPISNSLTINKKFLLASNTTSSSAPEAGSTETKSSAPQPKTSKSSSKSTSILAGAGIAIVAGAVAAAAGGSGSDSDTSTPASTTAPSSDTTDIPSGNTETIHLASLVRIGDDRDYNGNHPDHFKQNTPSGLSWSDTFTISAANTISSAIFRYTVAGSKVGNPIYVNGKQAGRLCDPGNTAWNVKACSLNVIRYIHSGTNEIKIRCAIDETDTTTPYDDVELYDLRIELGR